MSLRQLEQNWEWIHWQFCCGHFSVIKTLTCSRNTSSVLLESLSPPCLHTRANTPWILQRISFTTWPLSDTRSCWLDPLSDSAVTSEFPRHIPRVKGLLPGIFTEAMGESWLFFPGLSLSVVLMAELPFIPRFKHYVMPHSSHRWPAPWWKSCHHQITSLCNAFSVCSCRTLSYPFNLCLRVHLSFALCLCQVCFSAPWVLWPCLRFACVNSPPANRFLLFLPIQILLAPQNPNRICFSQRPDIHYASGSQNSVIINCWYSFIIHSLIFAINID